MVKKYFFLLINILVILSACTPASGIIPETTPTSTSMPTKVPTATTIPMAEILITNLEGNERVYQNDSLVAEIINDPTGAEEYSYRWYRNGILLDDAIDNILDNESMKTFKGNFDEYTPASSHTDHTIRGYEFKVEVLDKNNAVIGSAAVTISGPEPELEMRGMNFATWESRLTTNGKGKDSLESMKSRLNTNWVSIWTLHYQDGLGATEIYAKESGDPSTITDEETIDQINAAHELGMKVILYPQIWLNLPEVGGTPGNRERIIPSDAWFESYKEFIIHQADIAERTSVDIFVIGVELLDSESKTKQWVEIIQSVRDHFKGPITYSSIAAGKDEIEQLYSIPWFSELDYIGISTNFEYHNAGNDATLSETAKHYEIFEEKTEELSRIFGKPLIILESSTSSVDGALKGIHFISREENIPDHQEQADYFDAFLRVFGNKPYIKGIFFNQWISSQENWYKGDSWWPLSVEIIGKPAERVLSSWYGGQIP